jgi:hypothetical protein
MKWLCGLVATAASFVSVLVPAGRAQPAGALVGLEAICLSQGGTFLPGRPAGVAWCTNTGLIIYSQIPGSYERSGLVAIDRLCKAAGFGGVEPFGKGTPDGGFAAVAWGCYAAP